jgi:ribose transport system ATP-binding protein/rhamnose transport system ATP-binding protein
MYPPASESEHAGGLVVENLHVPGAVHGLSMTAPRGRIVCVAGQIGSGATAVTRALAGIVDDAQGRVTLDGRPVGLGSVPDAVARGILFITDDRAAEGIFGDMSVLDNLLATRLAAHSRARILSWPRLRRLARRLADRVSVDATRLRAKAGDLSGGNQQKLLVARALDRPRPGVLLMNEPTRGIDVGARSEIYRLMRECCAMGYAVVMTSSDLEEVVGMADIVLTLYRGRLVSRYERQEIAMARILGDITHPAPAVEAAA